MLNPAANSGSYCSGNGSIPDGEGRGVYPYLKKNLLILVTQYVRQYGKPFDLDTSKDILRRIAVALQKVHEKGWRHMDLKPDDVLVNYTDDGEGRLAIHDLMLTDFDLAWQGADNAFYSHDKHVGHYLWQSLEAIASKGVSKPNDIFAYGLMCLYILTRTNKFVPDGADTVKVNEILARQLSYFGPLQKELITHIDDRLFCVEIIKIDCLFRDDVPRQPSGSGKGSQTSISQQKTS